MSARPPGFLSSLAEPPRVGEVRDAVRVVDGGMLIVPSGILVACDGLIVEPRATLKTRVPVGKHPLLLGRVDGDDGGGVDGDHAWAMLRMSAARVVTWRADAERNSSALGYGVDSGNGCFLDVQAAEALEALEEQESAAIVEEIASRGVDANDAEAWQKVFGEIEAKRARPDLPAQLRAAGLEKNGVASVVLDEKSGANILVFTAGAGDGVFATWVGVDSAGAVACVVTDFGLLDADTDTDDDADGEDVSASKRAGADGKVAGDVADPAVHLRKLFAMLASTGKIELAAGASLDVLATQAVPVIARGGAEALYEWLLEQTEVDEIFLTDEELEQILAAW